MTHLKVLYGIALCVLLGSTGSQAQLLDTQLGRHLTQANTGRLVGPQPQLTIPINSSCPTAGTVIVVETGFEAYGPSCQQFSANSTIFNTFLKNMSTLIARGALVPESCVQIYNVVAGTNTIVWDGRVVFPQGYETAANVFLSAITIYSYDIFQSFTTQQPGFVSFDYTANSPYKDGVCVVQHYQYAGRTTVNGATANLSSATPLATEYINRAASLQVPSLLLALLACIFLGAMLM
jgi:hypothetical protein